MRFLKIVILRKPVKVVEYILTFIVPCKDKERDLLLRYAYIYILFVKMSCNEVTETQH